MKHRNFIKSSIVALLPISLGIGLLFGINKKPVEMVEGYSTSLLPTTIDLNDTSAANIRSYYSSLNNKTTEERQGTNLLKNLKTILKNGQKYYSYDSGNAIWQIYEIADRDWDKSPASSTTYGTYNSSTNKITNYTYGTSSSSSKNNPYIHALYINRNVTNQTTAWDDHQQTQWGINREHVWPKAEGFETSGAGGARGDPMHLMAGNGYANNIHSNYFYGYVNTSSSYTNCGSKYSNLSGNLLGKSKTLGGSTNVFEPQDSDKGDIARAIFYMVARYNYYGSVSDTIDSNNPNLALTQSLSDWSNSGYSSTTSTKGYMGVMTDLLAWHHADPVDAYEIHRNNILFTNFTNNRNPFIDFPEWADFIWGSVNYSGTTYKSHSTTPTGYATPSTDTINGYNSGTGETVAVTGISLDKNSASVEVGSDTTLVPTISPSDATNQGIVWSTSNSSIATVSGGLVTGVAEGTATITATTSDGGYTAQCTITVTASEGSGGQDGVISFSRSGTTDTVTSGYNLILTNAKSPDGGGYYMDKSSTIGLDVDLKKSSGTIWATSPSSISLTATVGGGSLKDPLDNNVIAYFLDSSGNTIASSVTTVTTKVEDKNGTQYTVSMPSTNNVAGVRIHHDKESSYNIRLFAFSLSYGKTITSITLDTADVAKTFYVGDEFEYGGLSVIAHYGDNTEEPVSGYTVSTPDLTSVGTKTVTVTYNGLQSTYQITVKHPGRTATSQMIVNKSSSTYYSDGAISLSGNSSSATAECDAYTATQKRTSGNSINYENEQIRVFGGHTFTVTPKEGYELETVVLHTISSTHAGYVGTVTNANKSISGAVVTLSAIDGTSAVAFYNTTACTINYIIVNFIEHHLSWESPSINVFSGSTLTASDVNSWGVTDGSATYTAAQLTVKLGGEVISIPHAWSAFDDGKTLKATYSGISTPESIAVRVTQSINSVAAPYSDIYDYEFTEKVYSEAGSQTLDGHVWTQAGTNRGTGYWGYDDKYGKGHQFGSTANSYSSLTFSSSDFSGTINSITIYTCGASSISATVTISVGGTSYGSAKSITTSNAGYTFSKDTGAKSGTILIEWSQPSTNKAIYIKEIVVRFTVNGNIANNSNHIDAQRAAVKFANAFNAAMDTTEYCTVNLSTAWSTCSTAYNTFLADIAEFSDNEKTYAKNLIRYANAQYTDDSGEACIERMMKTYEVCVQKHGQSAFMSDLVSLNNIEVRPLTINVSENRSFILIVIVSVISVSAIGGYFFLKSHRKEEC